MEVGQQVLCLMVQVGQAKERQKATLKMSVLVENMVLSMILMSIVVVI